LCVCVVTFGGRGIEGSGIDACAWNTCESKFRAGGVLAGGSERVAAMPCSMVAALHGRPAGRSVCLSLGPPTPRSSVGMVCVVLAS
jgi:hypothetical protein